MRFRTGKVVDARELARVALACEAGNSSNITFQLGRGFLEAYYRVSLNERHSVVACATSDDSENRILGFVMGTLDAQESLMRLRQHRLRLLVAASSALLFRPKLIRQLVARYMATKSTDQNEYVVSTGPRCTYWGMDPAVRAGASAIVLFEKWLSLISTLGASTVRMEVDLDNTRASKVHRALGGKVVREFSTPAGLSRAIVEYQLPRGSK